MRALLGIAALLLLEACFFGGGRSHRLDAADHPRTSLVVGYIQPSSVPGGLGYVDLVLLDPPSRRPYYSMRLHDGFFYSESLPPGAYVLYAFGSGRYALIVPRQVSPFRLELGSAELRWLGAFYVVELPDDQFDFERLPRPTERDAWDTLLPFAEGTVWEARIRAKLGAAR